MLHKCMDEVLHIRLLCENEIEDLYLVVFKGLQFVVQELGEFARVLDHFMLVL